jgi:hypothetical protein
MALERSFAGVLPQVNLQKVLRRHPLSAHFARKRSVVELHVSLQFGLVDKLLVAYFAPEREAAFVVSFVLSQRPFAGVVLGADVALVALGGMRDHVVLEFNLSYKPLVANIALEWPLSGVDSEMFFEGTGRSVAFAAQMAGVCKFFSVSGHVMLQRFISAKPFSADVAKEGQVFGMSPYVLTEMALELEFLRTLCALKRSFVRMPYHVSLQICLPCKDFIAQFTLVRRHPMIQLHVSVIMSSAVELPAALRTHAHL